MGMYREDFEVQKSGHWHVFQGETKSNAKTPKKSRKATRILDSLNCCLDVMH